MQAFTAGQVGTIWVAVVAFAALAFWQYGAMPERDERLAVLPSERVIAAQRDLADASRAESASNAQAESTMAMIGRINSNVGQELLANTYRRESLIHRSDSLMLALRESSLRAAEDRRRNDNKRRANWTQAIQYGLLVVFVVIVVSAIAATFVWFAKPLDA